jgi:hypothetical protein
MLAVPGRDVLVTAAPKAQAGNCDPGQERENRIGALSRLAAILVP